MRDFRGAELLDTKLMVLDYMKCLADMYMDWVYKTKSKKKFGYVKQVFWQMHT
jgi:hypothetical protein